MENAKSTHLHCSFLHILFVQTKLAWTKLQNCGSFGDFHGRKKVQKTQKIMTLVLIKIPFVNNQRKLRWGFLHLQVFGTNCWPSGQTLSQEHVHSSTFKENPSGHCCRMQLLLSHWIGSHSQDSSFSYEYWLHVFSQT